MKPEKRSSLLQDESWWLDNALYLLNHKNPIQRGAMRRLVAAWDEAGRDAGKMLQALPELRSYLYDKSGLPAWGAAFATNGSGLRLRLVPDDARLPRPLTQDDTKMRIACVTFIQFLLTEPRERLAGPCKRKQCDKYWLRKRTKAGGLLKRKPHCSPHCCRLEAATDHTRKQRKNARKEKLRVAANLAEKWRTARTKDDWKQWVSKQPAGVEAEITSNFLTGAVNRYGLVEPKKGR